MSMPSEKATGLVIRTTDWSETSRIATIWTREFGKVRVLAKGGRRLRSNFEVALDLLSVCSIVLLRKTPGGLDLLTEARVDERFPGLRGNLRGLYGAYYLAELLDIGTEERDPHPGLFDAGLAALRSLGSPNAADRAIVTFEMAWLRELGYAPRLDTCAVCGRPVNGSRLAFGARSGGVLCPQCAPAQRDRRPFSGAACSVLGGLARGENDHVEEWRPALRSEIRQLLGHYISHILGRRPKLLGYLE